MSTTAPETDADLAVDAALESRQHHPSDLQYIGIAALLAVMTAIEVAVYYLKASNLTLGVFFLLMIGKFSIVVAFFMHLRFDSPLLRRLFLGGLTLAISVYTIVFFMFGVYHV